MAREDACGAFFLCVVRIVDVNTVVLYKIDLDHILRYSKIENGCEGPIQHYRDSITSNRGHRSSIGVLGTQASPAEAGGS